MPRARLIPITTVIQAVSTVSNGRASIPELLDALHKCYDFDTMMIYRGTGYGLADAFDGNPLDEYGGYNDRRAITDDLFNSCYWKEPGVTIRHRGGDYDHDEFLMTKADGLVLAYALWEFFESDTFDVDWFTEITKTPCKPLPKAEILTLEKAPDEGANSPGCWPWGNHQTELLGHLEAAAREFWTGYDPQNAKATAPKNETVIAWLEARNVPGQKKKVSNQMATAIATMLRPEDLPTGPRK